ncbi:hypothetical protein [Defluviitalea phaphyphila]|uniref:hypothetical protein n=1 Tax=Defluviitalea phaphyphila TaxID=1473580 RepID=UPI00072FAD9D|nr:hypothetical protein [Defluviitalea phaphyphila]
MRNKKFLSILLVLIFSISIFSGCGKKEKEITLGTFENNKYSNDYFGFTMEFPEDWHIATDEEREALMAATAEIVSKVDEDLAEDIDLASQETLYLALAYKYPPLEYTGGFNPNISCKANNLGLIDSVIIKTGKDYLEYSKEALEETDLGYKIGDISTEKIGDTDFYVLDVSLESPVITVYQKYYVKIIDKYALSYLLTYSSEEEKNELTDILNTVSFEK